MGATSDFVLSRAIKFWHAVALKAQLEDYSHQGVRPQQDGPCYTSRMSAMVHLAIYDAYVGVSREASTYLEYQSLPGGSKNAGGGDRGGRRLLSAHPTIAEARPLNLRYCFDVLSASWDCTSHESLQAAAPLRLLQLV